MIQGKKVVALIPLRGGSRSIPRKNIKLLSGKPLCQWTIEAVAKAKGIDGIYVSTEDDEIAGTVEAMGLGVKIIKRPEKLATDTASIESVMLHFASEVDFDILITLQATSPLTTNEDIDGAMEHFFEEGFDSLVTGVRFKRYFWGDDGRPMNYIPKFRPRRQNLEGWIMENGAFYITKREVLEKERCRLGGSVGIFLMNEDTATEINGPMDWEVMELLIQRHKVRSAKNIQLIIADVDGTLTDAGLYYGRDGDLLKKFNTQDAYGIKKAQRKGIETIFITGENTPIITARAKKLGIEEVHLGIQDKLSVLKEVSKRRNVPMDNIAFIGDDENDLECIKAAGFSGCPNDALPLVKKASSFVCERKGGEGAVREFIEVILANAK